MVSKIRDLMTPAPIVLRENQTAIDAARLMKARDAGDVLGARPAPTRSRPMPRSTTPSR